MKTLHFRDDKAFYEELTAALKSGEPVRVETPFRRYSEVPQKLKDIFEMHKQDRAAWMNVVTGIFTAGTVSGVSLNCKPLVVVGVVATGAAIGGGIGAAVGAAVGAGIGLAAGTVAAVLLDGKHTAQVEITKDGRLVIKVEPARS
jgi:hypothetical protein